MNDATVNALIALNHVFYDQMAAPFADSRATPSPGFWPLAQTLPQPCRRFLDVGCGEGRLGRFLLDGGHIEQYVGVDFSAKLLAVARDSVPGTFRQANLLDPVALDGLGTFDAVAAMAVFHHVPGRANRLRLLRQMAGCVAPGGRLLLSTWQFLDSARQRRKIRPWSLVDINTDELESADYLLYWQRGGVAYRYVCAVDSAETAWLAAQADLDIVHQFRSDGREGDLSLYTVMQPMNAPTATPNTG
jgi:SAM-dependent methyltransferase